MSTDHIHVRKAAERDRRAIALCIAEGFERDFAFFCRDTAKVSDAIAAGIRTERFHVAESGGTIVAAAAISDRTGRAVYTRCRALCRNFGPIKGIFAKLILKPEFERPLPYPPNAGFIEFVAVRTQWRRHGIATTLLHESMQAAAYPKYLLEAIAENRPAVECYRKIGFREVERREKPNGYTKVLMIKD